MARLFQFETFRLDEWRDRLRDINFWLHGYLTTGAYNYLEEKLDQFSWVQWNIGFGPKACFTRAISSIVRDRKIRRSGPFDYVIEVDMKQAAALSFTYMLTIKVAEVLGLLDRQEYNKLKDEDDEVRYCSYGLGNAIDALLRMSTLVRLNQIFAKLSTKRYLLLVRNLDNPIDPIMINAFTEGSCLPPPLWSDSFWLVSTASQDVYDSSKPDYTCTIGSLSGEDLLMLTLYSLHQAAKYILDVIIDKDEKYWHIVALRCFHHAVMLLIPYCSSTHSGDGGDQQSSDAQADITSDELIRRWAAQGILPLIKPSDRDEIMGKATDNAHGECTEDDIYRVGNVILQAFQEHSLVQLPFSPSTKEEGIKTAAHFLAYNDLMAEQLTVNIICEDKHPGLERMQWISFVDDQGWHVCRDWLSQGAKGPATLIIRHCSQQSRLFANLDHLLAKFSCLYVLDLSYSPLISLPSSVCYLQNLRLLSLTGCYNLPNPFNFPNNEITTTSINLLYLDLSYSNVKTFDSDLFHCMPNVQELMLIDCSNLEELPPSFSALTNLTGIELTGTKIHSFCVGVFVRMKKLRSLKLINNKNLLLIPDQVSKASCDLINQHDEGWDSILEEEVKLEAHPTLRSFSLIGSPHIKRLSLYGCRKLESLDIKQLDALEELNMSATGIKELPVDIPNLPRLRRLLLMGVPSLRRFPWHELQRLPDAFYLDQCSDGYSNDHYEPQAVQVYISDSRFFYSFNYNTVRFVRDGKLLKSFYIGVTSRMAKRRKMQDEEDTVFIKKKPLVSVPAYADVNHRYLTEGVYMVSMDDVPPFQEAERHVEISAVERYPRGLKGLLDVTKSIVMTDDTHVSCLDELSRLSELEECMLRRCHTMVDVFREGRYYTNKSQTLRNACVSRLKTLIHFSLRVGYNFKALKHLRLEHCPRLEGVMPCGNGLPSLVTLDILFCYNLKAIFYYNSYSFSARYEFPCLRRMHLQELPKLQHILDDNATLVTPAWEELNVRGCWSLRRLPRLDQQQHKKAVEVSGERAWWAKLQWDQGSNGDGAPLHRGGYKPVLPPASASFRERVIIESYLR